MAYSLAVSDCVVEAHLTRTQVAHRYVKKNFLTSCDFVVRYDLISGAICVPLHTKTTTTTQNNEMKESVFFF